jgi:hypothetical protein
MVPVSDSKVMAVALLDSILIAPDRETLKTRSSEFTAEKTAQRYLDLFERVIFVQPKTPILN